MSSAPEPAGLPRALRRDVRADHRPSLVPRRRAGAPCGPGARARRERHTFEPEAAPTARRSTPTSTSWWSLERGPRPTSARRRDAPPERAPAPWTTRRPSGAGTMPGSANSERGPRKRSNHVPAGPELGPLGVGHRRNDVRRHDDGLDRHLPVDRRSGRDLRRRLLRRHAELHVRHRHERLGMDPPATRDPAPAGGLRALSAERRGARRSPS